MRDACKKENVDKNLGLCENILKLLGNSFVKLKTLATCHRLLWRLFWISVEEIQRTLTSILT